MKCSFILPIGRVGSAEAREMGIEEVSALGDDRLAGGGVRRDEHGLVALLCIRQNRNRPLCTVKCCLCRIERKIEMMLKGEL